MMWDIAGPQQDPALGEGLQGSSSRAVTRASQVCPWTVSALSLISRAASDVLIFSFFRCRKKNGPGMRTKCSSCTIPSTGKPAWWGDGGLSGSVMPFTPCHAGTMLGTGRGVTVLVEGSSPRLLCSPKVPSSLSRWQKLRAWAICVPGKPNGSEEQPQPCWGGGSRHLSEEASSLSRQGGRLRFAFLGPRRAPGPVALSLGAEQRKRRAAFAKYLLLLSQQANFPSQGKTTAKKISDGL